jgi:hypothetical protein
MVVRVKLPYVEGVRKLENLRPLPKKNSDSKARGGILYASTISVKEERNWTK